MKEMMLTISLTSKIWVNFRALLRRKVNFNGEEEADKGRKETMVLVFAVNTTLNFNKKQELIPCPYSLSTDPTMSDEL